MVSLSKKKQRINDELATMVRKKFDIASQANREAHQRCLDALNQIQGTYFDNLDTGDDEDQAYQDIKMNITLPIATGFRALLAEILDPIMAQPFILQPSPIVELPPELSKRVRDAIEEQLPTLIARVGGDRDHLFAIVDQFTEATKQYEFDMAQQASERLTKLIRDRLIDAKFSQEFTDWLYNYTVYPLAIMKGPIYSVESKRRWGTFGMTYTDQMVMRVKNISPFDFFPAPKAKDPHTCPYVIERMRVHAGQLVDLSLSSDGYDQDAIDIALDEYESYIIPYEFCSDRESPDSDQSTESPQAEDEGYYDLLGYYGRIKGKYLVMYGVDVEDERRFYEAEVWVLGHYVIKASLNPNDKGRRPFEVKAFAETTGELWGKSPVEIVRDAQRQCTVAGRALARNMQYSSAPIGEVASRNVIGKDDPQEIYPHMIRAVNPLNGGQNVYRFYSVPSLANELMAVYDKFSAIGYDLLGLPRISLGDMTGNATLGRSQGGIAMVINQASKPVKQAMSGIEQDITRPIIQKFVDEELLMNPDIDIRGDIEVQVRGVQSLIEKERKEGALEWALQSLVPFAEGVTIPREYIMRIITELLEQRGVDTTGLPDFDLLDAVSSDLFTAGATPTQGEQDTTETLDGRSQVAIDQIQSGGQL